MAYKPFFSGDEARFDEWVGAHPFGTVVNSSPGKLNPSYLKAHRPSCHSFQKSVGAKTEYSKHCFDSASEALDYLHNQGMPRPSFGCSACKVSALEPTTDVYRLERSAALLLKEHIAFPPKGNRSPARIAAPLTTLIQRDPAVVAWVLAHAAGKCELCNCDAPFETASGRPYLEVHHVKTLSNGGPDTVDNAIAVCPNCHRSMHHSSARESLVHRAYANIPRLAR